MFSLADLTPAQEPFDLGDGRTIHFRNKADFDIQELAAWERLKKSYTNVTNLREKASSEEQHAYASRKSGEISHEIISLVLPDLPTAVRDKLTAGQIDQLATMCQFVARGDLRRSSPTADQLLLVDEKFPDLPPEFVASLNRQQVQRLIGDETEQDAPKNQTAQPVKS